MYGSTRPLQEGRGADSAAAVWRSGVLAGRTEGVTGGNGVAERHGDRRCSSV
ncbi:hypothetical protein SBD_0490 [Streptomyces bottropensis ATCC 25435]|uniref:Uncharacterized protein n=1 Tax=Streptomyces bottropensis ATCC 25435 TaxID=1054862 RepID=M3DLL5_9ACTN|nr:hypothetical protein SBD_0490 [Streptomyces bottropensis ATCC 25435]